MRPGSTWAQLDRSGLAKTNRIRSVVAKQPYPEAGEPWSMGSGDSYCFGQFSDSHGVAVGMIPLGDGLKIGISGQVTVASSMSRIYFQTDNGKLPVLRWHRQVQHLSFRHRLVVDFAFSSFELGADQF